MSEGAVMSVISVSIAAVLMTLILSVVTGCQLSDIRDKKQAETCAAYGNEWKPVATPNGTASNDWTMACVKVSR